VVCFCERWQLRRSEEEVHTSLHRAWLDEIRCCQAASGLKDVHVDIAMGEPPMDLGLFVNPAMVPKVLHGVYGPSSEGDDDESRGKLVGLVQGKNY
jgi:hypothetical protein